MTCRVSGGCVDPPVKVGVQLGLHVIFAGNADIERVRPIEAVIPRNIHVCHGLFVATASHNGGRGGCGRGSGNRGGETVGVALTHFGCCAECHSAS